MNDGSRRKSQKTEQGVLATKHGMMKNAKSDKWQSHVVVYFPCPNVGVRGRNQRGSNYYFRDIVYKFVHGFPSLVTSEVSTPNNDSTCTTIHTTLGVIKRPPNVSSTHNTNRKMVTLRNHFGDFCALSSIVGGATKPFLN